MFNLSEIWETVQITRITCVWVGVLTSPDGKIPASWEKQVWFDLYLHLLETAVCVKFYLKVF